MLFFSWNSTQERTKPKPIPRHVVAVVVEKPKSKPVVKPAPKPKPVAKPKPKPQKPKPKPKAKPKAKPKPKPAPQPKPAPKPEPKPEKVEEQSSSFSDLLKQEMESLETKKKDLPPMQGNSDTQQELDEILQYQALIKQTVTRYWRRPPSARNEMEVMLALELLPGGELKNVKVHRTSGDKAFDNSAVLAVQNAGRFSVPPDPVLFDRHFRSFKIRFKPGDLRY